MILKYAIELMQTSNYSTLWLGRSAEDIEKELRLMALSKLRDNYGLDFDPTTLTKDEAYTMLNFLYGIDAITVEAYDELDYAFTNIFTEEILEDAELLYDPKRV